MEDGVGKPGILKETIVSISFDPSVMEITALVVPYGVRMVAGAGFVMTNKFVAGRLKPRLVSGAAETRAEARVRNVVIEKMPFILFVRLKALS